MLPTKLRGAAVGLLALAVLGAGTLTPAARAQDGKGKKTDQKRFQGAWEVVSGMRHGEQLPEEITKVISLTFQGEKVTFRLGDIMKEGTFKLDPSKKPAAIDLSLDDKTAEGIYAFDGKQLKLCVGEPGGARPTEFKSEAAAQTSLIVLRPAGAGDQPRPEKKQEKKADAPAQSTAGDAGKTTGGKKGDEHAQFQGTWKVVSAEKGGEKLPEEILKDVQLVVSGDKIKLTILGEEKEGTFKIDPTKKPKTIDLTAEGKTIKGIYKLSKDSLIVSASEPDQERPKEFEAGAGSQTIRIVFKRAQAEKKPGGDAPKGKTKTKTGKAKLDGSWTVVAAVFGGENLPDEIVKTIKVTMADGKVTMEMMGETKEGTYKADLSKTPATLDVAMDGKQMRGICLLKGDTLKVCMADGGEGRPSEFKSEAGSQTVLMTMKRAPGAGGEAKGEDEASLREEVQRLRAQLERTREELEAAERRLAAARQDPPGVAAQRQTSANNLKQIALAMHNYHDTHNAFPANAIYGKDGKALLSWRVAILPYIEENALYNEFKLDEPWDSAHNKKLLAKMPKIYAPVAGGNVAADATFYQVFTGPGTIFEGKKGLRLLEITDGTSNTFLAAEAGEAVPWTKPDDLPFDPQKDLPKLGGLFKAGFHVAMADGSVRFIRRDFDPQALRLAITRNDGQVIDLNSLTAER